MALRAVFHAFSFEITGKSCKRRKQRGFNENAGQIAEGALCGQSGGFAPQSRKGGVLQAPLSYLAVPKEEGGNGKRGGAILLRKNTAMRRFAFTNRTKG